jgi:hypothetical protein
VVLGFQRVHVSLAGSGTQAPCMYVRLHVDTSCSAYLCRMKGWLLRESSAHNQASSSEASTVFLIHGLIVRKTSLNHSGRLQVRKCLILEL